MQLVRCVGIPNHRKVGLQAAGTEQIKKLQTIVACSFDDGIHIANQEHSVAAKFVDGFQLVSAVQRRHKHDFCLRIFVDQFLALLLNTIKNEKFKKFVQSVTYMPHFISIVVLFSMFNQIFSPTNGLYLTIYRMLDGIGYPKDFRSAAATFRHIHVWTGIWQNLGWSTIIYTAALSSVSNEHHEAAQIDGANRFQRILHVDLPAILPTVCIMLIMRCGSVMSVGFEKTYLLQSDLNLATSEVISTYVYKAGMGRSSDFSYGAAVGLFNSVVNCVFLIAVNWITKKLSDKEVSLF